MLFHVTHEHSNDTCPGVDSDIGDRFETWLKGLQNAEGVKVLGAYVAPIEHTLFFIVEAAEYGPLAKAFGALNSLGSGAITPVMSLDTAISLVDSGTFRLPN